MSTSIGLETTVFVPFARSKSVGSYTEKERKSVSEGLYRRPVVVLLNEGDVYFGPKKRGIRQHAKKRAPHVTTHLSFY